MFTGIVEEVGKVEKFTRLTNGARLMISCSEVVDGTNVGDSIAVDGVCQTVVSLDNKSFSVDISDETLSVTTFEHIKIGDSVNLERALTLSKRLGGHIVTGHVDGVAKVVDIEKNDKFYRMHVKLNDKLSKYVVSKGSVAINGISLTVASVCGDDISCAIIPHTYLNTNLKNIKSGDNINIEVDIMAKYVEKLLSSNNDNSGNKIDVEFLKENGFV